MEEQQIILGLTEAEVLERKERGEINIVEEKTVKSNWEIISSNVFTLFNLYNFLIAIALMSVGAYSNLAFMLIIILNICIGSFQEIHAKNMVAKLSVLTVSKVDVIRDGKEKSVGVDEVVLDDITILNVGNQISSDSVVIDGKIEVNESLLTGESDTIVKMPGDKLYSGSYVVSGKCYAKVEKVGKDNLAAEITLKSKKHKKVNSELLNSIMKENMIEAQKQGKRVLLVGFSKDIVEDILPDIEIVAAIELSDPLRKNAKEMLGFFKGEGVTVKVISGDNPLTVSSIAKQAGLEDYESYIDLSTIESDDEIIDLVDEYSIFARVSPNQKSLLVQALQAKGHTVAMTGDGVNDVIALRQADCSITLPEASDVAKQVSQIVLLNSDFSVLKDALMEGRRVVNNITNVATIFFIKTLYSVMLSILNIITCTAFPFIPIQITLVDLAIEGYTSFFISFEPNGKQIKERFLKSVLKNSFPYSVVIIINIIVLYLLAPALGIAEPKMTTLMYYMIGFTSIVAVIRVCRPFNKMRVFLCTTTAIGFFVATILFRNLLHLSKLGIQELIVFLILAILSTILILIKNYLTRVK